MTTYGKSVLTGVCLVAGYAGLLRAFRLMNAPSDGSLYSGLTVVLALLAVMPLAVRAIWRRRT